MELTDTVTPTTIAWKRRSGMYEFLPFEAVSDILVLVLFITISVCLCVYN